ncbi:MAG: Holliday junction branch migration protein RuvA [Planctomycetota bacterium]
MIVRLTGTLADVYEDHVVLERDGIAREVLVPRYALGELAACRGREITLHTLEYLEGNAASGNLVPRLIGFVYPDDKRFFSRFISVKGIGVRKALKALAEPVARLATWIKSGDAKALARLPGIGSRAAQVIVAELQGKIEEFAFGGAATPAAELAGWTQEQKDALEVLVAWGDPRPEAERWLQRAAQLHPDIASTDGWVRAAYRIKTGAEA